ncbi:MAG: hypothetical protein J6Q54_05450 [Oscillospiraceae bacterium]|nr:hypothetical protein [Oscillospiraceae bacterium]
MKKEKFDFIQPFKDIPKTLKGFPKNLVHIWKDKVTNSAEIVERRKEIYPYIYLFAGLFFLLAVLSVAIPNAQDVMMYIAMVPGAGVVAGIFLLSVLKKAEEKFSDLECSNCHERIAFDQNVQIKVVDRSFAVGKEKKVMGNSQTVTAVTPMYVKVTGKETTTVEITCKCQKCGTEKTFRHAFVTVECSKFQNKVAAASADVIMTQFEQEIRAEGAEGFEGKSGTTARGIEIKYKRSVEALVAGYFGNEIQMR